MDGLPSGTVTLLFSDVEGSTLLLRRLGDRWPHALDLQRRICREAWVAHGGHELGTEGDSFFVVFGTAEDGVRAAVRAQQALAEADWPGQDPARVRMGVHTGAPRRHGDGYVGIDVHTAARIAAAAAGGQVLVSEVTLRLAAGALSDGVTAEDVGEHRLKDIPELTHLYRLIVAGLVDVATPPRTLGRTGTLPRQLTRLVGREAELSELLGLLDSGTPLLTLTGAGGSGKTRLATALGAELVRRSPSSSVYFVDLANVSTATQMWGAIAEVLDVPDDGHLPPKFFEYVADQQAVLILDNLEQIPSAATVVAALLEHARGFSIVATSRRPLHVVGEHQRSVPPLTLPASDALDEVGASEAATMFVTAARRAQPSFALTERNARDVAHICRRLDGLPLAIELVAARSRLLSPHALLARMRGALDLPSSDHDVPSRQKTLRATVGWSYDLLDTPHQAVLRMLGAFAAGAHIASVEAVAAELLIRFDLLEAVAELMDASLVTAAEAADGEPRVVLLDTIRTFALRELEGAEELEAVKAAHARYFRSLAGDLASELRGSSQLAARDRFTEELDNFREALTWSLTSEGTAAGTPERTAIGLGLCNDLFAFWRHSAVGEAAAWLELAVDQAGADDRPGLAAALGFLAQSLLGRDPARARDLASAGARMAQRQGDEVAESGALAVGAWAEHELGARAAALELLRDAVTVARRGHDSTALAIVVLDLSILEGQAGHTQRELELVEEGRALASASHDHFMVLMSDCHKAMALRSRGEAEEALTLMKRLVPEILAQHDTRMTVGFAEDVATVLGDLGRAVACARLLGAVDAARSRLDRPRAAWEDEPLQNSIQAVRTGVSASSWETAYEGGGGVDVEAAIRELS